MTQPTPEELRAARWVLGESEETRPDPALAEEVARMEATVRALQAWGASHVQRPVKLPRRRLPIRIFLGLAAAAAAVIVVVLLRPGGTPPPEPPIGAARPAALEPGDLAWIDKPSVDGDPTGKGGPPPPTGAPGAQGEGMGSSKPGTYGNPRGGLPKDVPRTLPGGYRLVQRKPLSDGRMRFSYQGEGGLELWVFVGKSEGPDTELRETKVGNRPVWVHRRSNVIYAFEGEGLDAARCRDFTQRLLEAKGKENP